MKKEVFIYRVKGYPRISIPKAMEEEVGLENEEKVLVENKKDKIIISKIKEK